MASLVFLPCLLFSFKSSLTLWSVVFCSVLNSMSLTVFLSRITLLCLASNTIFIYMMVLFFFSIASLSSVSSWFPKPWFLIISGVSFGSWQYVWSSLGGTVFSGECSLSVIFIFLFLYLFFFFSCEVTFHKFFFAGSGDSAASSFSPPSSPPPFYPPSFSYPSFSPCSFYPPLSPPPLLILLPSSFFFFFILLLFTIFEWNALFSDQLFAGDMCQGETGTAIF